MLQGEHSAILLNFHIKLPFVIEIFVLSIFEWSFYTGFTVLPVDESSVALILIRRYKTLIRNKAVNHTDAHANKCKITILGLRSCISLKTSVL